MNLTEMERLIAKAVKALEESPFSVNEIELSDGANRVRVVRNPPTIFNSLPYPWHYQTQFPNYNTPIDY